MNDEKSEQDLDELLTRHLGVCLDGQRGRAAAAFRARQAARLARRRWWIGSGAAAAAMAAALAVAWVMLGGGGGDGDAARDMKVKPDEWAIKDAAVEVAPPMVQSATWSPVRDEGLAVVDDQPVRQLRRQIVEEVEWYDARDGAMVRTRVPRQQVILIGLRTD
jgi:hypothetical protein